MRIIWFDEEQKEDIRRVYRFYHGRYAFPCILCDNVSCAIRDELNGFCYWDLSKAVKECKKDGTVF